MRPFNLLAAVAGLVLLMGCARVLDTQVTSVSDLPEGRAAGATIAVIGASEDIARSLIFRRAKDRMAAEFRERGFVVVPNDAEPRYVAAVDYRMGEGETTIRELSQPVFGIVGYTRISSGGKVRLAPVHGIIGYEWVPISVTTYGSALMVYIHDTAREEGEARVYEGRVTARGSCGRLDVVLDDMITALFEKFPDQSGRVRVKSELDCD
ncbi:MAG: hypothetical protein TEF_20460 [Rhizobiales bacterium NRL2]|jgi:hypothetical protein|nr:MAG: hypothetical protein TEF_20460 [Rhizobiales bacterium NRL2]